MQDHSNEVLDGRTNIFLSGGRFEGQLKVSEYQAGDVLAEADQPFDEVFFPKTAVISLVVPMEDSKAVEVAVVGNEGMIGLPVALDTHQHLRAIVQVPGSIYRLKTSVFREAVREDQELSRLVSRFILVRLQQIAQTAACNQLHRVEQRLCRWLLTCHDRVGEDSFQLTHRFLADMLGVRRASISDAAARLQVNGLIRYKRGRVTITDRERLEEQSCDCYQIVRSEIDRLLE